ncbi:hypothetical protein ED733_002594 [Metarhizium rileyi]|uniref:Extracellular membrane protein CFEM domain-containing protein n=1 Tax=Metarhizium rileyi (strain RCEF 4871) TaxID=1649241 RepID=A0A5C6G1R6_METRR|nr:hypothetical protein ED733_002594 [Metarhizium rileyi]
MKSPTICAVLFASAARVLGLDSLSGYTKDIPKCAYSALADGMTKEGCDVSKVTAEDFDCLCKHISAISIMVVKSVETTCAADFAQAAGSLCGMWNIESTTATDLAAATSALADALDGKGSVATPTAATSTSISATKNIAAVPTGGVIRILGGLAAAAAGAML